MRNIQFTLPGRTTAVSAIDRMFFTEQLALLLETGESLHGALTTIVKQTENPRMREIIERVAQDISEGMSFADILRNYRNLFMDGLDRVLERRTTIEEVSRVTSI